jgi:hypothetical protein
MAENLQTGSVLIQKGNFLVLIAFFPSTPTVEPGQLKPFIAPALANLSS